jgi:hypothetical protein
VIAARWWWLKFINEELEGKKRIYTTELERELSGFDDKSYMDNSTVSLGAPTKAQRQRIAEIEDAVLKMAPNSTQEQRDEWLRGALYRFLTQDKNWYGVGNPWALFLSQWEIWFHADE